jgi:acetyl-CoA C-acetyltransferase
VSEAGEQGGCIARMATLAAGWPTEVTGVSLNRFCGSGQQAVNFAMMGVMAGQQELAVGAGVESMSRQPMGSDGAGLDGHNRHLREMYPLVPQGISADLIATIEGFSREECDRFAYTSQQRAKAAVESNRFAKSLVPVHSLDGQVALDRDEYPRPSTTPETLAQLEPSFVQLGQYVQKGDELTFDQKAQQVYPDEKRIDHVHTAGNSSGIVDGAAAVLIASPGYAKSHGLKPRARVRAMATHGAEPVIMLTAPVPATRRCLEKAGMTVKDIDLFEINEAFAAIPLKVIKDCGIDPDLVNVNGGAIALGHPLGATGAMLIGTILDELERRDKTTGLITMCIGGGMGITTIIERI